MQVLYARVLQEWRYVAIRAAPMARDPDLQPASQPAHLRRNPSLQDPHASVFPVSTTPLANDMIVAQEAANLSTRALPTTLFREPTRIASAP